LTQAKLGRGRRVLHAQPGIFVGQLHAITHPKIDVNVGRVRNGLTSIEKRHVAHIDFPIEMTRGARIIGVVGWAALRKYESSSQETKQEEQTAPHHT